MQTILSQYVSHASVSTDPNFKEGMVGARKFVEEKLASLGFEIEVVQTPLHPIVLARRAGPKGSPHVLLYAHYDVQPADPLDLWQSDPFNPEVRDGQIYGRGVTDNKGPFISQISGIEQLIKENPDLPLTISFLVEGEEEMGSPSFPQFLDKYKDWLAEADVVFISDTSGPSVDQIVITTALRGLIGLEVEVVGPKADLHSGLHGGAVMNPIRALMDICASLHGPDGKVAIDGFYDGVDEPYAWERDQLERYPLDDQEYKKLVGVQELCPQDGLKPLEGPRFAPTLEFNGISGGYQGEGSKTIIPSKASVKITCRLVGKQNPDHVRKIVTQAIEERCPKGVQVVVHQKDGGAPYLVIPPNRENSPKDYPARLEAAFEAAHSGVEKIFKNPPIYMREGGSIPIIAQIHEATGLDCVMIGLSLNEDGMHSPNEKYDLRMLERGSALYKEILGQMAGS